MKVQQTFNLNMMQIQHAAAAGVSLFQTPGAVKVDGTMAVTEVVANLQKLLNGIATGQLMVMNVQPQKTDDEGEGEEKEGEEKGGTDAKQKAKDGNGKGAQGR